ncbi:MAG: CRISPR-associated protein Csx3 [Cyanothece sp. SIO2G6]|nr:CRISPR-associated protein Csx3 [Cyanothece sp. SIO2G6]
MVPSSWVQPGSPRSSKSTAAMAQRHSERRIALDVISLSIGTQHHQTLVITLTQPRLLISPQALKLLHLPADLDLSREVILFGQAPIWLYGRLVNLCRAAPWIACYNVQMKQCVVIHSRVSTVAVGEGLTPDWHQAPCPAILIGGPPDSGKSVFAYALRRQLIEQHPTQQVFLHRANWDGEGNWAYETPNLEQVDQLVQRNERRMHESEETQSLIPDYFRYHARAVENVRSLTDIALVDVGGCPQPEKEPLLQQCTHYIIISRSPDEVGIWHQFCQPHLKPIAVIYSVLEAKVEVLSTRPVLEIIAGPWVEEQPAVVPDCVVEAIATALLTFY